MSWRVVNAHFFGRLRLPFPTKGFINLTQQANWNMRKIEIAPLDRQARLIFFQADRLIPAQDAFEMSENNRGTFGNVVEKFSVSLVTQREKVAVERLIKPPACIVRILRVIKTFFQGGRRPRTFSRFTIFTMCRSQKKRKNKARPTSERTSDQPI